MKKGFKPIKELQRSEIRLRDPFVFTDKIKKKYYLFGTTFADGVGDKEPSFDFYMSEDLEVWKGPYVAFEPTTDFWGIRNFWAPEVHQIGNRYFMFMTAKGKIGTHRGTGLLVADKADGPYFDYSHAPITPSSEEALDGTYYLDRNQQPWLIYCHEWTQIYEGQIKAVKLSQNLKVAVSEPIVILRSSDMSWVRKFSDSRIQSEGYLTDAPFAYRTAEGQLLLLWSSYSQKGYNQNGFGGYTVAVARSRSGRVEGPWEHEKQLLLDQNAGHSSLFTDLNGNMYLCTHYPDTPHGEETPLFLPIKEVNNNLILK